MKKALLAVVTLGGIFLYWKLKQNSTSFLDMGYMSDQWRSDHEREYGKK